MLKIDNIMRVLEVFFENPTAEGGYQLRELSRMLELAPKSVKLYLGQLEKEGLIVVKKSRVQGYPTYYANRDKDYFRWLKKLNILRKLEESRLIEYLHDACLPDCIFLFGSTARGEDIKTSDIDIYLQCKQKNVDLKKFEKKLNRKINLIFEVNFGKLSDELKSNIINGIKLKGYLDVKWKG